jgi:hypothetical protein
MGPVAAIITALTVGITLFSTRANAAERSAQDLSRVEFTSLTDQLTELNEAAELTDGQLERRKVVIDTLNTKYGEYLGNIELDKVKNEELKTAVEGANEALDRRITIQALESRASDQRQKSIDAEIAVQEAIEKRIRAQQDLAQLQTPEGRATFRQENAPSARSLDVNTEDPVKVREQFLKRSIEIFDAEIEALTESRNTQLQIEKDFIAQLSALSPAGTGEQGERSGNTAQTGGTDTKTKEQAAAEDKRLAELRIQTLANEFAQRRAIIETSFQAERAQFAGNAELLAELEERRALQLLEIRQQEAAQITREEERITRIRQANARQRLDLQRQQINNDFDSQAAGVAPDSNQALEIERQRSAALLQLRAAEAEQQQSIVNTQFEAERQAFITQSTFLIELERRKQLALLSARSDDARDEVEKQFEAERQDYIRQAEFLIELEQQKNLQLAKIDEDYLAGQAEAFAEQAEIIDEIWQRQLSKAQAVFNALDAGWSSLWQQIGDTSQTGSEKFQRILDATQSAFLTTIGEMLKQELIAIATGTAAHEAGEATKTAATSSGVASRASALLVGLAKEVAAIFKTVGAYLAQMAAKLFSFLASLGPLGVIAGLGSIPALVGAVKGTIKGIAKFAQGGIATDPTLALFAEAGSPEAAIPLNEQGANFIARLVPKIVVPAGGIGAQEFTLFRRDVVAAIEGVNIRFDTVLDGVEFLRKNDPAYQKIRSTNTLDL